MKNQSYAHELADELDDWSDGPDTHLLTEKAATELRRLQEANVDCTDHFNALKKDFDALRAENEQLKANKQIQSNVAGDLGKALRDLIEKADDADKLINDQSADLRHRLRQIGFFREHLDFPGDPSTLPSAYATPDAPTSLRSWVRVPMVMTQAMRDVTDSDEWSWEELLAAAEAITEQEYEQLSTQEQAPSQGEAAAVLLKEIRFHAERHLLPRDWLTKADQVLGTWAKPDTSCVMQPDHTAMANAALREAQNRSTVVAKVMATKAWKEKIQQWQGDHDVIMSIQAFKALVDLSATRNPEGKSA